MPTFTDIQLTIEIGQPTYCELILAKWDGNQVTIHRELADPTTYQDVRALVWAHTLYGYTPWVPYIRMLGTNALVPCAWTTPCKSAVCVVAIADLTNPYYITIPPPIGAQPFSPVLPGTLQPGGTVPPPPPISTATLVAVQRELSSRPELLPSRMRWELLPLPAG